MGTNSTDEVIRKLQETANPDQSVRVHKIDASTSGHLPFSRRDYYKVWMTTGKGFIHYASRSIAITGSTLIFSNPLVPYSLELERQGPTYTCMFKEEFLKTQGRNEPIQDSSLFKIGSDPVFPLNAAQAGNIRGLYEKMLAEMESAYTFRFDIIRNYLNLLIYEGLKMKPSVSAIKYNSAAERIATLFLELLDRQFPIDSLQRTLSLKKPSDYAVNLSVHVNHLNHAVRETTGKSTTQHINDRVINEAKALLVHSDWSISEIAYSLGFEYPNYFSNFFRKNTGVTPLSLRK